jgi:hypothetical protein
LVLGRVLWCDGVVAGEFCGEYLVGLWLESGKMEGD